LACQYFDYQNEKNRGHQNERNRPRKTEKNDLKKIFENQRNVVDFFNAIKGLIMKKIMFKMNLFNRLRNNDLF